MSDVRENHLGLIEALDRWCERRLVEAIRRLEASLPVMTLESVILPRLSPIPDADPLQQKYPTDAGEMISKLRGLWSLLDRDFKARLTREELFLDAVPATKGMDEPGMTMRGALASEFVFDYRRATLRYKMSTYSGIIVATTPTIWSPLHLGDKVRSLIPGAIVVADLDDDVVIALLNEHADRAIARRDPHFIVPSKVSLMPIIVRKMEERQRNGELASTLVGEARALERWIATAVRGYQTPKAASIKNHISAIYGALKA